MGRVGTIRFDVARWLAATAAAATLAITFWFSGQDYVAPDPHVIAALIGYGLLLGTAAVLAAAAIRATTRPELFLAAGTSSLFTLGLISVYLVALFWPAAAVAGTGWILVQRRGAVRLTSQVALALGTAAGIMLLNWLSLTYLE